MYAEEFVINYCESAYHGWQKIEDWHKSGLISLNCYTKTAKIEINADLVIDLVSKE